MSDELDDDMEEHHHGIHAALSNGEDEGECSVSYDGKHTDLRLDPDWNEIICSACNEAVETYLRHAERDCEWCRLDARDA